MINKRFYAIFASLLILSSAALQAQVNLPRQNDLQRLNLNGQVKQIIMGNKIYEFNSQGFRTHVIGSDPLLNRDGDTVQDGMIADYQYDAYNRVIKLIMADGNGNLAWTRTWKYESDNRSMRTEKVNGSGRLISATDYKYNDKGQVVQCTRYDGDGNIITRKVSTYSPDKHTSLTTIYDKNDNVMGSETYFYDPETGYNTEVIVREIRERNGETYNYFAHKVMRYDVRGNILNSSHYLENGALTDEVYYSYNSKDICTRMSYINYSDKGDILGESNYKYNRFGWETKRKVKGYVYEYDEWGHHTSISSHQKKNTIKFAYAGDPSNNWVIRIARTGNATRDKELGETRKVTYF